jgi:hypothetical protein
MKRPKYNDDYPTCLETFSTLRIFSEKLSPTEVTKILKIKPTESFQKGEPLNKGKLHRKTNGWFFETENTVKSRDTRRHIDFILQAVGRKGRAIKNLHQKGCQLDIISYFVSTGQGGPALWPHQMLKLGQLGVEIWWDVYFKQEDEKAK